MLESISIYESDICDVPYVRFLQENTLYDEDTKEAFINDETAIINAFAFNFIGILGTYNAGVQANQRPTVKAINLYFKGDKSLRLKNITDDNNNISLSIKLMADKHMFISDTKVNEMTRFLVLAKMGHVDNIDDDVIRGWVSNIKQGAIMKADPKVKVILQGFKDGKLTLVDASKELRKISLRYVPVSSEYIKLSKRINFKDLNRRVGGAGIGNNDNGAIAADNIGDDTNDLVSSDPIDTVVNVPVKTWRDYDHDDVVYRKALKLASEATENVGLVGLASLSKFRGEILNDYNIADYEFDVDDSDQGLELLRLNKLYHGLMYGFYIIGTSFTSIRALKIELADIADRFPLLNTKYKNEMVSIKNNHGVGELPANFISDLNQEVINSAIDYRAELPLFGLTVGDMMNAILARESKPELTSFGTAAHPVNLLLNGSAEYYEKYPEVVFYFEQYYGDLLKNDFYHMMRSASNDVIKKLANGLFSSFTLFNEAMKELNGVCESAYLPTILVDYAKDKMNEYIHNFFLLIIDGGDKLKFKPDLSFMDRTFLYIESQEEYTFREMFGKVLSKRYWTLLPISSGYMKSSIYNRCLLKYINSVGYDNIRGNTVLSVSELFKYNPEIKAQELPKLIDSFKDVSYSDTDIVKMVLLSTDGSEKSYRDSIDKLLDSVGDRDNRHIAIESISRTLRYDKQNDARNAAFLQLYSRVGGTQDIVGDLGYDFAGRYDFNAEHAIELMKLEVKHGFKVFDPEKIKGISYRARKDQVEQMMLDMMVDATHEDPDTANLFYENMDNYYKKRIKDRFTAIEFVFGQLRDSELNMHVKNISNKRINQIFKYNDIDPKELMKSIKMPTVRKEKFSDYINRVDEYSKTMEPVVAKLKIEPIEVSPEYIVNITEHLMTNYYNGKHGNVYPKIINAWNCTLPTTEYQNFLKQCEDEGDLSQIIPCFHGTGGVAANMILRYGFKVIPPTDQSAVGRMLGDGIYFGNSLDKVMQYVGNGGYSRSYGTTGYIFVMESVLGKPHVDYESGGFPTATYRRNLVSPEWVVRDANKQLKINKVYEVELVPKSKFILHMNDLKSKLPVNESINKSFKKIAMLSEAKTVVNSNNKIVYQFLDGKVPMMVDGRLQHLTTDKVVQPKGFSIYTDTRGTAIVEIPSTRPVFNTYKYCKELKNKEFTEFMNFFENSSKY